MTDLLAVAAGSLGVWLVWVGARQLWTRPKVGALDAEVETILHLSALLAQDAGDASVTPSHFLAAARCNRAVARQLGPPTLVMSERAPSGRVIRYSRSLARALSAKASSDARHGDKAGLAEVLAALREVPGADPDGVLGSLDPSRLQSSLAEDEFTGRAPGVYVLNDRTTPMDRVVAVLERHFGLDRLAATYTMLRVHHRGYALAATVGDELAARRIIQEAAAAAEELGCPELAFTIERPDTSSWSREMEGLLPPVTTGWSLSE